MRYLSTLSLIFASFLAFAQWTTKSGFPAIGRNHPVTFSIDGKGFAFTGFTTQGSQFHRDGYRYDPATDNWSSLSNFPGAARGFAVGLSFNGKGYLGFGLDGFSYLNDFWEYNPTTDSWTQLASCPCLGRRHPAMVVTDSGKIYMGLGDGLDSTSTFRSGFADWWEYDIAGDSWTRMTDLPAQGRHHPYYFAIGDDAYVGFGHFDQQIFNDFYKFNSDSQQWTTLNNFPGEGRVAGAQFAYKGQGYIVDGEGMDHRNLDDGEFYRYDPVADQWTTLESHIGDGLWAPGAFLIDDMVYVTGGDDNADNSSTVLWAYSLEDSPVDSAISVSDGNLFTLSSDFYDQNATLQWVDCSNNFAPVNGLTSNSVFLQEDRNYALVVTYSAGGIDTSACYTPEEIPASIASLVGQNNVFIYPNPTTDRLKIKLAEVAQGFEYKIIDQLGVKVMEGRQNDIQADLDLTNLSSGIYFVQISTTDGSLLETRRIRKQN